jgi:hypothetical protein
VNDWNDTFNDDDEFVTDDRQTGQTPNDLVKQLRAKIKADQKAFEKTLEEFKTLKAADRTRTIEKVLSDKEIPAKVAKLIPADLEPTETAIDDWLKEYGELFGVSNTTNDNDNAGASAAAGAVDRTTLARIDASTQNAVMPGDRMLEQIERLKTMPEADFLSLIDAAQKGG